MNNHFESFFVCPRCKAPIVRKEGLADHIESGAKFCPKCGQDLASAYAEALAKTTESKTNPTTD